MKKSSATSAQGATLPAGTAAGVQVLGVHGPGPGAPAPQGRSSRGCAARREAVGGGGMAGSTPGGSRWGRVEEGGGGGWRRCG